MIAKRVHVSKENLATLKCPHCGIIKFVSVAKFRGHKHSLKVKCTCGNTFTASLNFRKHYRKSTSIAGKYVRIHEQITKAELDAPTLKCTVTDLSLSGLSLSIPGAHELKAGDEVMVHFILDDHANTEIKRKATVRYIDKGLVGCRFSSDDSPFYDKALGFYLMP